MQGDKRSLWLTYRRQGIGGSDAAAVLGYSKWKTPLDIYYSKINDNEDDVENSHMKWGNILEPIIRQEYSNEMQVNVIEPNAIIKHPKYPFLLATIDGYTADGILLEIKTSLYAKNWGEEGTDQIPADYYIQVQHYLLVTGLHIAHVAVLIGGCDFRIYVVEEDKDLHVLMIKKLKEFWGKVENRTPPAPVTEEDLNKLYPTDDECEINASTEINQKIDQIMELKKQQFDLDKKINELQFDVKLFMGEKQTLVCHDEVLATWKTYKGRTSIDASKLKKEQPDIFEKYKKIGADYRMFKFKR